MNRYRIINTVSGSDLGIFDAADEQGALDAMAREAGYKDYVDACTIAPVQPGELLARLSTSQPGAAACTISYKQLLRQAKSWKGEWDVT
jgi:hypothetical protein